MASKLEVINYVLSVVSESPVSDPASNHPTVQSVLAVVDRVNKEVQQRGWWFNKELSFELLPDGNGYIILPSNTLKAEPSDVRSVLIKRGARLYDPVLHTFNIGIKTKCNLTVLLNIEDLPETAATFIQHRAAYDFYVNDDGDETKSNRLEKNVAFSWQQLNSEELAASNVNSINRPISALLHSGIRQYGNTYAGNPLLPGGRLP